MDYKEKYKMALETVQEILSSGSDSIKMSRLKLRLHPVFPELAESENEKIRKSLIEHFQNYESCTSNGVSSEEVIAWLEKQGEQKPFDYEHATITQKDFAPKQEPKFNEGDWIVRSAEGFKHNNYLIKEIEDYYVCEELKGRRVTFTFNDVHKNFKSWNISDAKDGDVLVTVDDENDERRPFIYKGCLDPNHPDAPVAYCGIDTEGYFCTGGDKFNNWWTDEKVQPATKEQRDLLFSKMREAGYEWDSEKKELKEIKKKTTEWSEEDETGLTNTIIMLKEGASLHFIKKDIAKAVDWLKSLKERLT